MNTLNLSLEIHMYILCVYLEELYTVLYCTVLYCTVLYITVKRWLNFQQFCIAKFERFPRNGILNGFLSKKSWYRFNQRSLSSSETSATWGFVSKPGFSRETPDTIIIVDVPISVYGSSYRYFFFRLILAPLLYHSIYWYPQPGVGGQKK